MNRMLARLLCVLLIGALLVPAGWAEDDIIAEEPVVVEESVEESVEEPAGEIPGEPVEAVVDEAAVEAVASEDVDASVEEAADVALPEDAAYEAQPVEEVLTEGAQEEAAPQPEASEQEVVSREAEDAAKVLAEGDGSIPIDEAHFPDAAFRAYISEAIDTDPQNVGYITKGEAESVTIIGGGSGPYPFYKLDGSGNATWTRGVASLQGIECFTNLQSLDCQCNPIAGLDVSMLKNLIVLNCSNCGMTSLNINGCDALLRVYCSGNKLATLDVTNCAAFASIPKGYKSSNFKGEKRYSRNLTSAELARIPSDWLNGTFNSMSRWTLLAVDKSTKVIGAGGAAATNNPTGFTETPGVTVTVNPASTAKNTRATVIAAPGSAVQLSTDAGAKKFKSSNKKVARVSKGGVVTFKNGGKVKITYKVGKKTRKVTLTVIDPTMPTAVAFTAVNTAVKKGESVTLTPTVNEGANPGGYKWKSSNKKVATVKNGVVKFKKKGKVTITCTTKRGKKKARVTFTVSK